MDKTAIKNYAIYARRKLIQSAKDKAALIGIYEDKIVSPVSKGDGFEVYKSNIGTETRLNSSEVIQRNNLISKIKKDGFDQTIEEVAYTWFNRLIAIRFMEVNDYLPSRIRVLSSENQGQLESDLMLHPFESDIHFSNEEKYYILTLKETNKSDELFKFLFIKQSDDLSKYLPGLFVETKDYTKLLFDVRFNDQEDVVYKLINEIPESNFNVELEGQIEIIGWLYQYYNTEPKDKVYARPKGQKIGKHDIPAVTQLFTPDWIVKYMVENSLGRLWLDGHTNEILKSNWRYYLDEAAQEESVQKELEKIKAEHAKLSVEEIKLIDPCMGSGHILVYAFDVFMQLYLDNGYSERDAAVSILQNNLYGLDIDERAYQLSYFALMMKARQYNRRILTLGIKPNLYAFEDSTQFIRDNLFRLGNLKELGLRISNDFDNAKELGSIMKIRYTKEELKALKKKLDEIDRMADYGDLFTQANSIQFVTEFSKLLDLAEVMSRKYDTVVTNPPYTPLSSCGHNLTEYAKKHYPDSKTDFFGVFIEKCNEFTRQNRFQAMITMQSWMFLSSYEKLRAKLLKDNSIINMAHLGTRAFEEIGGEIVQTTAWVQRNTTVENYNSLFVKLTEYPSQNEKESRFFDVDNHFFAKRDKFNYIPGTPYSYWASEKVLDLYKNARYLADEFTFRRGISTGDNPKFLRLWQEIDVNNSTILGTNQSKWFRYNKGGSFCKWYGNRDYVALWDNDGATMKAYKGSAVRNVGQQLKKCISYSSVATGKPSFRVYDGFLNDQAGNFLTQNNESVFSFTYVLALLNSVVSEHLIRVKNTTQNITADALDAIPILACSEEATRKVTTLTENLVALAKEHWDSFECSWDFKKHPLVPSTQKLREQFDSQFTERKNDEFFQLSWYFEQWENECQNRFETMKQSEEEINKIFIDLYDLQDELKAEVDAKDVSVTLADKNRDVKSLISYVVGCMFGRYSLDVEGLVFAGGGWDDSKYNTFVPDKDSIIPICEEEYFSDDIVGRFIHFVEVVYGKETLDENLRFIADALGDSGQPKEILRKYFMDEFFVDHCIMYSGNVGKRPIYWQFDSGKQNGFKALVYLHRYDEDLVSRVRTDYLHKVQNTYEDLIKNDEYTIEHSSIKSEIASARKHMEKIQRQLAETKIYDQALAHVANQRIKLDLDDGVKVNYEKFQGVEVINEGSKTIKVDLLTKIK